MTNKRGDTKQSPNVPGFLPSTGLRFAHSIHSGHFHTLDISNSYIEQRRSGGWDQMSCSLVGMRRWRRACASSHASSGNRWSALGLQR
jgi:hypothetical protein